MIMRFVKNIVNGIAPKICWLTEANDEFDEGMRFVLKTLYKNNLFFIC